MTEIAGVLRLLSRNSVEPGADYWRPWRFTSSHLEHTWPHQSAHSVKGKNYQNKTDKSSNQLPLFMY